MYHYGSWNGGEHWERAYDYDVRIVSTVVAMGFEIEAVRNVWEILKQEFNDIGLKWTEEKIQARTQRLANMMSS